MLKKLVVSFLGLTAITSLIAEILWGIACIVGFFVPRLGIQMPLFMLVLMIISIVLGLKGAVDDNAQWRILAVGLIIVGAAAYGCFLCWLLSPLVSAPVIYTICVIAIKLAALIIIPPGADWLMKIAKNT